MNAIAKPPSTTEAMKVEYTAYPSREYGYRSFSVNDLRQSTDYQNFDFSFDRKKLNLRGEFRVFIYQPIEINLDKIVVK